MQNVNDKTTLKPDREMSKIFSSHDHPSRYINGVDSEGKFYTEKNIQKSNSKKKWKPGDFWIAG